MSLQQLRERIVNEIPISDLIQRYGVHLTRKSTGHVGVCPFHDDSNPSMSVSDDKRIYKCFACGAGTTHFDFVMNLNSLSFIEALKDICERFGIDFDSYTDKKEKPKKVIYAEKILKAASLIYHQIGQKTKPEAYTDFLTKREIPHELALEYQLGFAPKKNTVVDYINTLPKKDRSEVIQAAFEIGLIKYDESRQSHYDTFRDRIMFPIWDHFGKVIGFTSRAIHDYQKAKYMNSKESFVFNKRNLLYGLHLAKPFIRKRDAIILVEGNMDQVSTFKKGFEHCVAIMGTALGDNSLRTIKSLTSNVILSLDTDQAGYDAAVRINKQFLEAGIMPKYIEFTPHKDPDDFLKAEGSIAMQAKIDEAKAFIDIQFEKMCPDKPIEILDQKLEILEKAFDILAPLGNSLKATERLPKWAEKLGLTSSSQKIVENYEKFLAGQKTTFKPKPQATQSNEPPMPDAPPFDPNEMEEMSHFGVPDSEVIPLGPAANDMPNMAQNTPSITRVEETLVIALIEYPDCLEYDGLSELLDFMGSDKVKEYILKLRELIFEIDQNEFNNFALTLAQDYGLEELVRKGILKNSGINLDREKAKRFIVDLEKKLIKEQLKVKKDQLRQKRNSVQTEEDLTNLMIEIHKIEKKLYSLK